MFYYEKATQPTIYFIGVTTAKSSIMKVFPAWAAALPTLPRRSTEKQSNLSKTTRSLLARWLLPTRSTCTIPVKIYLTM